MNDSIVEVLGKMSSRRRIKRSSNYRELYEVIDQNNNTILLKLIKNNESFNGQADNLNDILKHARNLGLIVIRLPYSNEKINKIINNNQITMQEFEYIVYTPSKFPNKGQIKSSLYDIGIMLNAVTDSSTKITELLRPIYDCMETIKKMLKNMDSKSKSEISKLLGQPEDEQTWKMAGLILSNAIVFHDKIADKIVFENGERCKKLEEIADKNNEIKIKNLKNAWSKILDYNYIPIFSIARDILGVIEGRESKEMIKSLYLTAKSMRKKGISGTATMYGELLQRVITDRDKLASYYTLPVAAALMAGIVVPAATSEVYQPGNLKKIRIADFACGTGLLLSSTYRQILSNYEMVTIGKNTVPVTDIHKSMIEKSIIGLDVLPISTHLAVASLAMMFPLVIFGKTNIKTMPIGTDFKFKKKVRKKTKTGKWKSVIETVSHYRLGSLDLIENEEQVSLDQNITLVSGSGAKQDMWSIDEAHHRIPDKSCDLIVMNPPFTSNRNRGKKHGGSVVPGWASFGTSVEDQLNMGKLTSKKFKDTCAHDHAGKASHFIAICDKKIKENGTIALIIPSTVSGGSSWLEVRKLIESKYEITVISIARPEMEETNRSFSSDTGMGEVMIFANRTNSNTKRGRFVSIRSRPNSIIESSELSRIIRNLSDVSKLEDDKKATKIKIGADIAGYALDCPLGSTWKFVSVYDPAVEQMAHRLGCGYVPLDDNFDIGIDSAMITGKVQNGPFATKPIGSSHQKYVALWNNVQESQKQMMVQNDVKLVCKKGATNKEKESIWNYSSRVHVNINPRFTSNSLIAAYTNKSMGGSSWPNIIMKKKFEKPFVFYFNSTIGILQYWTNTSKQQLGRGRFSRGSIADIPIPNFKGMDDNKLAILKNGFNMYYNTKLDRMKHLWKDKVRNEIDAIVCNVLNIDVDLDDLRLRLCMEPSLNGGEPEEDLKRRYKEVFGVAD